MLTLPPYLIIDYDLTEDIRNVALRGVDVRIVTPYIPDKKIDPNQLHEGAYPDLMEAGVKISMSTLSGFYPQQASIGRSTKSQKSGPINFGPSGA